MRLGRHVEALDAALDRAGEVRELGRAHARDDAAVLHDHFGADQDEVDGLGVAEDVGGLVGGDGLDFEARGAEFRDGDGAALVVRVEDVDHLEVLGLVGGGVQEDLGDGAAAAGGQDDAAVDDVAAAPQGDLVAAVLGALREEILVVDQVLARLVKGEHVVAGFACCGRPSKRPQQVLLEQVGAGEKGERVRGGGEELGLFVLDQLDELHGGRGGGCSEHLDQGLDGGDAHGQVAVRVEEVAVGLDDAGRAG